MNLQLSYSELQKIISKSFQKELNFSYIDEKTVKVSTKICGKTLSPYLTIVNIFNNNIVIYIAFEGIDNIAYKLSTKNKDG